MNKTDRVNTASASVGVLLAFGALLVTISACGSDRAAHTPVATPSATSRQAPEPAEPEPAEPRPAEPRPAEPEPAGPVLITSTGLTVLATDKPVDVEALRRAFPGYALTRNNGEDGSGESGFPAGSQIELSMPGSDIEERGLMVFLAHDGRASAVQVFDPGLRTTLGLHVGSSIAALVDAAAEWTCMTDYYFEDEVATCINADEPNVLYALWGAPDGLPDRQSLASYRDRNPKADVRYIRWEPRCEVRCGLDPDTLCASQTDITWSATCGGCPWAPVGGCP